MIVKRHKTREKKTLQKARKRGMRLSTLLLELTGRFEVRGSINGQCWGLNKKEEYLGRCISSSELNSRKRRYTNG